MTLIIVALGFFAAMFLMRLTLRMSKRERFEGLRWRGIDWSGLEKKPEEPAKEEPVSSDEEAT